jgi:hypothetical protein
VKTNAGDLDEEGVPPRKPFRHVHPKDARRTRSVGGRKIGKGKKEVGRIRPSPSQGFVLAAPFNAAETDSGQIVEQWTKRSNKKSFSKWWFAREVENLLKAKPKWTRGRGGRSEPAEAPKNP